MRKKICVLILFVIFFITAFTQQKTQQEKIDSVTVWVQNYFNANDAGKLYTLTGVNFKKQLSSEKFNAVCTKQLFPLGKLNKYTFINYKSNTNKYKAEFEGATLGMFVSLDSVDKMETFLFQPYKDEGAVRKTKVISNNLLTSELDKQVDSIMQSYFKDSNTVGASIGIIKEGKSFYYDYGETKKGNGKLPSFASIYEIGSISKTFTATLLAFAVNEGKVKLEDPVNKYLPKDIPPLKFNEKAVTLQSLSNHSSGLPRLPDNLKELEEDNPYRNYDEKALMEFLKKVKLTKEPGAEYEYSNFAVGLLGVILEKVYKRSFEQLVLEKISNPLKMPHTTQFIHKTDSVNFVQGHSETGKATSQWDFKALAPCGALRSSVTDLLKYAAANIETVNIELQKALQLTHMKTFSKGDVVGLGWHFIKLNGGEVLSHGGGTGGFRATLLINPDKKTAIVILSNSGIEIQTEGFKILGKL